jgi:dephospho-CoA kinase
MRVIGLTGGIGAGKSTVSRLLAERGAVVIDADAITRELQQPGEQVFDEIVEAFGASVVAADGTLDRPVLAAIVFADPGKRRQLEAIVWPRVGERVAAKLAELRDSDSIVILDVPLLVESGRTGSGRLAQQVIVVAASKQSQLAHLSAKGVSLDDAEARIAVQAPLEEKLKVADYEVWNEGTIADLEKQVDELWRELST